MEVWNGAPMVPQTVGGGNGDRTCVLKKREKLYFQK
jgi:hypothetical protein